MLPEGRRDAYCLVEPDAPLTRGCIVWLRRRCRRVYIGTYIGLSTRNSRVIQCATTGDLVHACRRDDLWPITWTGTTPPPGLLVADGTRSSSTADANRRLLDAAIDKLTRLKTSL